MGEIYLDISADPPHIKLYHLEKALIGDAAVITDAKTIAHGNFDRAWEILTGRFENKRRMVGHHISGLLSMKKLAHVSYSDFRELIDACTSHVENLKFLGQEFTEVSEAIVTHLLAKSLDNETKETWEVTVTPGELPNHDETIKFLKGLKY